ncbi:MAG TPA: cupin domain-containing protein [Stellaceae bacterium]|jgi:AraC family transcriptional activator of mtrCDE|nr:cupin domain-containing protein [Stellaceae bacterium]
MDEEIDWLSRLLEMIPVSGRVDYRCLLAAPWQLGLPELEAGQMHYHIVLNGSVIIEEPGSGPPQRLAAGQILLLPKGAHHLLHDESGAPPVPARNRRGLAVTFTENEGTGEHLDMLCGRFVVAPMHERLLQSYLPPRLIVSTAENGTNADQPGTKSQLSALVSLMRMESATDHLGGQAMLAALSTAVFALTLRLASETQEAPAGLLALAGHPRLAPALSALFNQPAHPWSLPELASLCSMSRATFVRHFQDKMGRSASDMLTEIRMMQAANEMRRSAASTGAIGESVGYQSEAAFQRAFKQHMGVTPAQWRREGRQQAAAEA